MDKTINKIQTMYDSDDFVGVYIMNENGKEFVITADYIWADSARGSALVERITSAWSETAEKLIFAFARRMYRENPRAYKFKALA